MVQHRISDVVRRTLPAAIIAAFAAGIASFASPAQADENSQAWQTTLTPYVWAPTIKGELNFTVPTNVGGVPGPPVGITVTPSQYLPKLGSAFMFAGETRNQHWGILTDIIYLNLGITSAGVTDISGPGGRVTIPINTNVAMRLASTVWTVGGTFNLARHRTWEAEGLVGGRYLYAPTSISWNFSGPLGLLNASGNHYQAPSIWDGIVGVKGNVSLGDGSWFVPLYADVGTGDAHLTWQGIGGFGYRAKHGQAIVAVYRNLFYDMGNTGFLHNINLGGAALGYTFKL